MHQHHTLLRTKSIILFLGLIYFPSQIGMNSFMLKLSNLTLWILEIMFYTVRKQAWGWIIQIPEHLAENRRFSNSRHVESMICTTPIFQIKGDLAGVWCVSLECVKVLGGGVIQRRVRGLRFEVWTQLQCSRWDPSQDTEALCTFLSLR